MSTMTLELKSEWRSLTAAALVLGFLASGSVLAKTGFPAGRTVQACHAQAAPTMSASLYVAAKIGLDPSALARAQARLVECKAVSD